MLLVSGCADIFQGFGPLENNYIFNIPTSEVANQVRCELYQFLNDPSTKGRAFQLNEAKSADVTLTLKTDMGGYVQYLGIDLNKIGLTSLAQLVTANSKTPSLGAKIGPKSTMSAVIAMKVPQKGRQKAHAKKITNEDIGKIEDTCSKFGRSGGRIIKTLELKKWLENFFNETNNNMDNIVIDTIKLNTTFILGVDVTAGLNPFFGATYILPISGVAAGISPTYTHQLDIILNVCAKNSCKPAPEVLTKQNLYDAVFEAVKQADLRRPQ
jgi:hypothetical protein